MLLAPPRAWRAAFALGAATFAAIPLADIATTTRALSGDALFVAFDAAMLAIAALLAVAAWRAGIARPARIARTRTVRAAAHA